MVELEDEAGELATPSRQSPPKMTLSTVSNASNCRMNIAVAIDADLSQWYAETPIPALEIGLRRAKPRVEVNPS